MACDVRIVSRYDTCDSQIFRTQALYTDNDVTMFARLCVLPWMWFGHLPRWLRKRLEQTLTESERSQARRVAASLLYKENLVEKEGNGFSSGDEPASGGRSLVLPILIDIHGGGEAELDELGIELLSAGTREEIDPIFRVVPLCLRSCSGQPPLKARTFTVFPGQTGRGSAQEKEKIVSPIPGRSLVLPARDATTTSGRNISICWLQKLRL